MKALASLALMVILTVAGALFHGWVFQTLWNAFLVPAGLMTLPYSAFVGVALLMAIAQINGVKITKKDLEEGDQSVTALVLFSKAFVTLLVLGVGMLLALALVA